MFCRRYPVARIFVLCYMVSCLKTFIKMFILCLLNILNVGVLSGGSPHVGAGGAAEPHSCPGHRDLGGQAAGASRYCVI